MDPIGIRIWPEVCHNIDSKYTVLDSFNLLDFDRNMARLESRLEPYRSRMFQPHERLLFSLYDTEYYMPNSKIGFTTYNLISLLYKLDISFGYCQLWTNHHGISNAIHNLCKDFGSYYPIQVFENNYTFSQTISQPNINTRSADSIIYHFSLVNNIPRSHRSIMRCYIQDRELNKKTLLAWNPAPVPLTSINPDLLNKSDSTIKSSTEYLTVIPFTRIRDHFPHSAELARIYNQNAHCLTELYRDPLIPELQGHGANQFKFNNSTFQIPNHFNADFLQYSFLNLVCETVFDYPYPYITEKTFKCFWQLSPFIIVGAPGSLEYIKRLGFKTFDSWWDESYDQIQNPSDRLTKIFQVLDIISNWSLDHCQEVYNEMADVLKHNQDHYTNYYCKELLEQTLRQI